MRVKLLLPMLAHLIAQHAFGPDAADLAKHLYKAVGLKFAGDGIGLNAGERGQESYIGLVGEIVVLHLVPLLICRARLP